MFILAVNQRRLNILFNCSIRDDVGDSLKIKFIKQFNSPIKGLVKRLFLSLDDFLNMLFPGADFGKYVAHRVGEHVHEFVEERFVETERTTVAHRATQDAAQDVTAPVVARLNAIGNRKAQRADVVGDDAEGDVELNLLRLRRGHVLRGERTRHACGG